MQQGVVAWRLGNLGGIEIHMSDVVLYSCSSMMVSIQIVMVVQNCCLKGARVIMLNSECAAFRLHLPAADIREWSDRL